MAVTTVAPTNKQVEFRGKPKVERPRAADETAAVTPMFPKKAKRMTRKVKRAVKPHVARGAMSEAAMKKHLGDY